MREKRFVYTIGCSAATVQHQKLKNNINMNMQGVKNVSMLENEMNDPSPVHHDYEMINKYMYIMGQGHFLII